MSEQSCEDCGAMLREVTCGELFDRLLALDHSRQQPWGALHGQAVACYFLQHPNAPRAPRATEPLRTMLELHLAERSEVDVAPDPMTIHDVAVDGTFPASQYAERLERWARSIVRHRPREHRASGVDAQA